ncbi:MAG: hypothetical protein ACLGI8_04805 [Acidimicrobiia bacterium]|jgi:hypothetical protein
MVTSSSGVVLLAGLVVVAFGLLAFNRAHVDSHATGGFGSGLSPRGREVLAVVVIVTGLGIMLQAALGY